MSQVERRILELEFDNRNFESGVKTSMDTLDQLQRKLDMKNATDGFDKVERRANNVSFKGMENAISECSGKFTAFEVSATGDIDEVESRAERFSVKGILSGIADAALKFVGLKKDAQDDITDIQNTEERFTMEHMMSAVEELQGRFTALGVAGMTVISELTRSAMSAGKTIVSQILDPIVEGGKNRAMAIENARFTLQGLIDEEKEGAGAVDDILNSAKASVSGTAYAFNDAALAAAQFAATGLRAGPKLDNTMAAIAGTAATVNAEYSDIAHIFTTVAGNGRLMTEQLNQFSYRGMNAAATLADAFNDVLNGSSDLSEEAQQHIRELVEYGMSDIKDFTGSLEGITEGDLRALVSKGKIDFDTFSEIMSDTFGEHAKDANKTFNGSMANIRAALARTGAMFYEGLIKQEGPLVRMFNAVMKSVDAFNEQLKPLAEVWTTTVNGLATGAAEVIETFTANDGMAGIGSILQALISVFKAFGEAFDDVFSVSNWNISETVGEATKTFKAWAESIKPSSEQLDTLKRIATGVFSALKIGGKVIGTVINVFGRFLGALKPVGSVLVNIAADFGDWLKSVSDFLDEGDALNTVVDSLGGVFDFLGGVIGNAADSLYTFFKYISGGIQDLGLFDSLAKRLSERFDALKGSGGGFNSVLDAIKEKLSFLKPIFEKIGSALSELGSNVKDALSNAITTGDFSAINAVINEGLFAAILLAFRNFVKSLSKPGEELSDLFKTWSGIPKTIGDAIKQLLDAIKSGTDGLNPNNLIKIAVAVGLLAASLLLLGSMDLEHMAIGVAGVAAVMGEFALFMKVLPKVADGLAKMKGLTKLTTNLILLAVAIDIMASAMKKMGELDYEELIRGIVGLGSAMAILVLGAKGLSKLSGSLKGVGLQLILLAAALTILTIPVKAFSKLNVRELAKGLGGLAGAAVAIGLLAKALDGVKVKVTTATSLVLLAGALNLMAIPVQKMASIPYTSLAKGLLAVGAMLAELGLFANVVKPEKLMSTAVSMTVLSAALAILSAVVTKLSAIKSTSLLKGVGAIGVLLTEMGLFANLVKPEKMLSVSAAMVILSGSMVVLGNVVQQLGAMSVEDLAKGLISIAAALTMFAVACFAMKNAMAGAMAISTVAGALVPLAFSLQLLAAIPIPRLVAGLVSIAATFAIFGVAGAVLGPMLPVLLGLAGTLLALGVACLAAGAGIGAAAAGISMLAAAFAAGGAALVATVTMLFAQLPFFFQQIGAAIIAFIEQIAASAETLMQALVTIGSALLSALAQLVPQAVDTIMLMIMSLITALTTNIPVIAQAMLDFIVAMLNTIADHIGDIAAAGLRIITEFMAGIAAGLPGLIDQAFKTVIAFINGLADAIRDNHQALFDAIGNLITAIVEAIVDGIISVAGAAGDLIGGFFDGIDDFDPISKIVEIAENIVNGFIDAIKGLADGAADAVQGFFGGVVDGAKDLLGIASPSKVFADIGENTGQGWINGLERKQSDAEGTSDDFAQSIIDAFTSNEGSAKNAGDSLSGKIVDGLQSNSKDYGNTATSHANSFVENVRNKFEKAKQAGTTVTNNTVNGLKSNSAEYGNTGTNQTNSFITQIQNKMANAKTAGTKVTTEAVNGLKSNSSEYGSNGTAQTNSFVENVRNKFEKAKQAGTTVTNNAVNGLKSNATEYTNTGTTQTNSFVENVRNKFEKAKQAGTTVTNNTVNGLKSNSAEYGNTGTTQTNSFVTNVNNKWNAAKTAGINVTSNAVTGLKSNAGEYTTTGDTAGTNFVGGLGANNYHGAYNKGKEVSGQGKSGADYENTHGTTWKKLGENAGQGYHDGMHSWLSKVINKAKELVRKAKEAAKAEQDSNSPSKEYMKLGVWAAQGYEIGMAKNISKVEKVSANMAKGAIKAASNVMNTKGAFDIKLPDVDGLDANPVITPVVDLGNVYAASDMLTDIFDKAGVFTNLEAGVQGIGRSLDSDGINESSEVSKAGTVINQTFNQVNNSPKSLSTLEIYRRTKGLMAQAKGLEGVVLTNA